MTNYALSSKLLFVLVAVSSLLSAACQQASVDTVNSNKIETSQIYQNYVVAANRSQSQVTATFRVGGSTGTTVELSAPGRIVYNGATLDKSDPSNFIGTNYRVKGTDYRKTINSYQQNHEFIYTDASNRTYQNSVSLPPIEIAAKTVVINKKAISRIPFSRPLAANETISLSLGNSSIEPIPDQYNMISLSPQRNAIILTAKFWKNRSGAGDDSVSIKVKKTSGISQGTPLGGSITIEYTCAPVGVKFGNAAAANTNVSVQSNTAGNSANTETIETNANTATNANAATNTGVPRRTGKKPIRSRKRVKE